MTNTSKANWTIRTRNIYGGNIYEATYCEMTAEEAEKCALGDHPNSEVIRVAKNDIPRPTIGYPFTKEVLAAKGPSLRGKTANEAYELGCKEPWKSYEYHQTK